MKAINRLYVLLFTLILVLPGLASLAGLFHPAVQADSSEPQAPFPSLMENGKINQDYLAKAGSWFERNYVFRQQLITANSAVQVSLLHTSPVSQVLLGKDGWYFYAETLDDWSGKSMLDARTQFEIAHNLKLMQWSVQSQGAQFAVMIAPNKNTIYPEKMPQGYQPSRQDEQTQSNIDAFLQLMQANGISAADIKGILKDHKEEGLYYQRDSHWNKLGSLYGYNELMRSLGLEPQILPGQSLETKADHRGDLDEMLFPQGWMPEEDFYLLEQDVQYSPKLSQDELMNTWIETDCPQKHGSILMFRDSFGSNLVPYVAQSFQKAYFSRLEPYNLTRISSLQVQYVVIEKVERRIGQFAQQAPVMFMPTVSLPQSDSLAGPAESPAESIDVTVKESGDFLYFQAMLPEEQIQEKTQIYLRTTLEDGSSSTVPVFYLNQSPDALTKQTEPDKTMQHGFGVYLPKAGIEKAKIEVLVENDDEIISHPVNPVQEDESE